MAKTFKHSGDLGDIIFALPAVRALGGGILCLDPDGGFSSPLVMKFADRVRTKLNAETIEFLKPLLLRQPYVQEVRLWHGEEVDYDLDQFRKHVNFNNISDSHLEAFGLPHVERDTAWLSVDEPIRIQGRPIIINRTVRYQGNHGFWESNLPELKRFAVFIGHPKEYEIFQYTFGHELPYYATPDVLTLARVIAGGDQFVGNQGLPHAIAEGLKKPLINEMYRVYPAAVFKRPGAQYV